MVVVDRGAQRLTFHLACERDHGGGAAARGRDRAQRKSSAMREPSVIGWSRWQWPSIAARQDPASRGVDLRRVRRGRARAPRCAPSLTPMSQSKTSAAVATCALRITRSRLFGVHALRDFPEQSSPARIPVGSTPASLQRLPHDRRDRVVDRNADLASSASTSGAPRRLVQKIVIASGFAFATSRAMSRISSAVTARTRSCPACAGDARRRTRTRRRVVVRRSRPARRPDTA